MQVAQPQPRRSVFGAAQTKHHSEEFSVDLGMKSQLCCHDTWPHLGSERDKVVQARLLGFALGSHVKTRMTVGSGLAGHSDPGECGPLRSPPCPLLPLQVLISSPSSAAERKAGS